MAGILSNKGGPGKMQKYCKRSVQEILTLFFRKFLGETEGFFSKLAGGTFLGTFFRPFLVGPILPLPAMTATF